MEKSIKKYFPIFALPTLVAFTIGFIVPFLMGIYLSFCEFTTVTDASFVGLKNYLRVFTDPTFVHALWYTALFTVVSVLTINVFAFTIAMLLTKGIRGTNVFRTVFFMPNLIGGIVLGYIWQILLKRNSGKLRKNIDLFFLIWFLGTDRFDELAADRLYDDHLYCGYPEHSG
mgnify:CR=1 FL=1